MERDNEINPFLSPSYWEEDSCFYLELICVPFIPLLQPFSTIHSYIFGFPNFSHLVRF